MPVQITVRNVPDKVRDKLAAQAALEGKSMQEYLHGELLRLAGRPSMEDWVARVRERKRASGKRIEPEEILKHLHADRR